MQATTFSLDALRQGDPMTIYIVLPPEKLESHGALLRLWLSMLMRVLMTRTQRPSQSGWQRQRLADMVRRRDALAGRFDRWGAEPLPCLVGLWWCCCAAVLHRLLVYAGGTSARTERRRWMR